MLRAALLCLFLATTALAEEPQLVEAGRLTWGSSPTFAPFEFVREGKPVGFDVELMEQLGASP
jgi:polar amino acid transport system substrate-binding protein